MTTANDYIDDPYWIEKVVACVVPLPGAKPTEDELLAYARKRLASFKVPKQIHVMCEFPKSPTGKVLKRVFRQRLTPEDAKAAGAGISDDFKT